MNKIFKILFSSAFIILLSFMLINKPHIKADERTIQHVTQDGNAHINECYLAHWRANFDVIKVNIYRSADINSPCDILVAENLYMNYPANKLARYLIEALPVGEYKFEVHIYYSETEYLINSFKVNWLNEEMEQSYYIVYCDGNSGWKNIKIFLAIITIP